MGKRLSLPLESFAVSTPWEAVLPDGDLIRLALSTRLQVTAGADGTVGSLTQDCPALCMANPFVNLALSGNPAVIVDPKTLLHVATWATGRKCALVAATPTATNDGNAAIEVEIPIRNPFAPEGDALLYRMPVRGRDSKLTGTFGALTDYGADNVSALAGNLEFDCEFIDPPPPGTEAFSLRMHTHQLPHIAASARDSHTIVLDEESLLLGIVLMAFDTSATANAERPDGMIRRVTVDVKDSYQRNSYRVEDVDWGNLKERTSAFFKLPAASVPAGAVFVPLGRPDNPHQVRRLGPKSAIEIIFNSSDTARYGFTAITPAAGDRVDATPWAYAIEQA